MAQGPEVSVKNKAENRTLTNMATKKLTKQQLKKLILEQIESENDRFEHAAERTWMDEEALKKWAPVLKQAGISIQSWKASAELLNMIGPIIERYLKKAAKDRVKARADYHKMDAERRAYSIDHGGTGQF